MASEAVLLEREKRKTAREDRLMRLVADPQVLGLVTLLGGLYAAQRIPFSEDATRNDLLKGLATTGVVLAALGRSGIGGWPALTAAGLSGAAGGGLFDFLGAETPGGFFLGTDKRFFGIPVPGVS